MGRKHTHIDYMDKEFHCYYVDDGEDLHILDVKVAKLQEALETDIY